MVIVYSIGWWYGRGFIWVYQRFYQQLLAIGRTLAVKALIKTWFAPWKQITSSTNINNFIQKIIDNLISRSIGFVVRTTILLIALMWSALVLIVGVLYFVVWPIIPILLIILPVLAISGVSF